MTLVSDYEYERDYWSAVEASEERYRRELLKHPDCRDPDHPSCEKCEENNDLFKGKNND